MRAEIAAMSVTLESEAPPLTRDATGAIRVGNSGVLLELVIHAFQDGATAEEIAQRYPTAGLPGIYGAISYYLHHAHEVEQYLEEREAAGERVKEKIDRAQGDLSEMRA